MRWQYLFLISKYINWSVVIKVIVQSCRYVGLSDLALYSNSSNCLVIIPHRFGEFVCTRDNISAFM